MFESPEGKPGRYNLVDVFYQRALMARHRLLRSPCFFELGGCTEASQGPFKLNPDTAGLEFCKDLPDISSPGKKLSAKAFEERYSGNHWKLLKGVLQANLGVVAELDGSWGPRYALRHIPTEAQGYHVQFATSEDQMKTMTEMGLPGAGNLGPGYKDPVTSRWVSTGFPDEAELRVKQITTDIGGTTVRKLMRYDAMVDGHSRPCVGFRDRSAFVIQLSELLEIVPVSYCSLCSVYCWWLEAPKLINKKEHQKKASYRGAASSSKDNRRRK